MLEETIQVLIILLLLYGCYTDLKWRHVSNKVTGSIIILALILFNQEILNFKGIFIFFLIVSWSAHMIGAADIKALVPIILSLGMFEFFVFLFVFCTIGISIWIIRSRRNPEYTIPGYIPITIAFIFISFNPFLF